jgi:hypothetical protein
MTIAEIEAQVERLGPDEQLQLLRRLMQRWQSELWSLAPRKIEETPAEYRRRLASIPPGEALLGAIRPAEHIPTDEEIREDYTNHLIRKYS